MHEVQSQSYSARSVLNKGVAARRALGPGRCVNLHALLHIVDSSTHSTTWRLHETNPPGLRADVMETAVVISVLTMNRSRSSSSSLILINRSIASGVLITTR